MNSDNISRWLHGIVWTSGFFTVICISCICMSGRSSWWVCAFTIGYISITLLAGYVTWTILHNLLSRKNAENNLARQCDKLFKKGQKDLDMSTLDKEITITSQTIYLNLILPWYSYISPDEKYALQIRSALEDLLTGITRNVKQNTDSVLVLQEAVQLYIRSYRQFYKSLKKVAHKLKKRPVNCVNAKEEIAFLYKPLHVALRTDHGVLEYFQKLSHFLLLKYLPSEVSKCNFFFVSLRDYFAYNFFYYIFDIFCESQWLYKTLYFSLNIDFKCSNKCITGLSSQNQSLEGTEQDYHPEDRESDKDKTLSYTHGLSAIKEETSFEMYDVDKSLVSLKFGNFMSQNSKIISNMNYANNQFVNNDDYSNSQKLEKEKENAKKTNSYKVLQSFDSDISNKDNLKLIDSNNSEPIKYGATDLVSYINFRNSKSTSDLDSCERSVKSALGGFISTTTVPLLPDISSFPTVGMRCMPRKMWQSPVEERELLTDVIPRQKKNPFQKNIVDGIKEDDYQRIFKKFLQSNFNKVYKISQQSSNNDGFMKKASKNHIEKGNKIPRSQSLNNLASLGPSYYSTDNLTSIQHSFSCDCILNLMSSEKNNNNSKTSVICRNDKKLKKMNSFDKNDGTDLFSLHSNAPVSSQIPDDESYESHCTAMINKININEQSNVPKIISSSESGMDVLQKETCLFGVSGSSDIESPSFGWENPDLSPIYEESENLASTIAKLRCLLSERQSQHSLGSQSSFGSSESEPKSAQSDPGRYSLEKSRFTFYHKDSTGSLASMKSTSSSDSYCPIMNDDELLEATEVPVDGRVFTYVSIPATEVNTELSGFQYTMYIIQYDAIYICEPITPNSNSIDGIVVPSSDPKVVLQTNFVKRRFREFLALHSALEDESLFRSSMKGIKGPNKWLNLPFSKLDAATISSRKQFLEKYLQALVQKPILNMSLPLKEFLAYGSDTSITFAKKHIEINVPRLDKILARTVSEVFHSIKTVLPTFDSSDVSSEVLPGSAVNSTLIGPSLSGTEDTLYESLALYEKRQNMEQSMPFRNTFEVQLDITADEQICDMEKSLLAALTESSNLDSPFSDCEAFELEQTVLSEVHSPFAKLFQQCSTKSFLDNADNFTRKPIFNTQISREESTDDSNLELDIENCNDLSMFSTLVDAAIEVLSGSDHPVTLQTCTVLFKQIFTQPLTALLKEKLESLLTTEVFQELFNKVRVSIIESQQEENFTSFSLEDEEFFKNELRKMLSDIIPESFKFILGQEVKDESLILLIESLQHRVINQDLCLHLFDLVFAYLLGPL